MRRILDLARRTGDRIIVTDPEGAEAFVLLSLDAYEALLSGKTVSAPPAPARAAEPRLQPQRMPPPAEEPPMATRRPIQRSRPEEEDGGPPPDIFDLMAGPGDETWDLANMGAAELGEVEHAFKEAEDRRAKLRRALGGENLTALSQNGATKTEKPADDEDSFGEEQFYLEPVE